MKKYSNYTVREFNYTEENEKYETIYSFEYKNKQEYHKSSMVNGDKISYRNIKLTSTYITKSTLTISNISYNYSYISLLSSNTPSYRYNNSYNLIEIVTKNNINMFDTGFSNNTSLFKLKDSFNSDNYTSFFNNSKFNDGSEIEFNFEVSDLNNESVTLKFTKRV